MGKKVSDGEEWEQNCYMWERGNQTLLGKEQKKLFECSPPRL